MANKSAKNFVFLPVDATVKISLFSLVGLLGVYAVAANSLILHFKRLQNQRRKKVFKRHDRFVVTCIFVQSLAVSSLLCALVSLPLSIIANFVRIIDSDFKCKIVRFCQLFFPVVNVTSLFVIGIERYLAVFHPFTVPTLRRVKVLVVSCWLTSIVLTACISQTYGLLHREFHQGYTLICGQNNQVLIYQVIYLSFFAIVYVLPSLVLSITSTRIILYMKQRRMNSRFSTTNYWRFYGTSAFLALIFTFIVPYLLFVLFSGLNFILKFQLSLTNEYIWKRTGAILAYANAAISPTVLLYSMQDLRRMFAECFRFRFGTVSRRNTAPSNYVVPLNLSQIGSPIQSYENRETISSAT